MPTKKKKAAPATRTPRGRRAAGPASSGSSALDDRVAIYPGSFDPITNGHVDIIRRACNVFSKVIVGVAYNPNKDAAMFTPKERVQMIYDSLPELRGRVEADAFTGLLVDHARQVGASAIIRGLRAVSDFEYEFQMTMMNRHLCPQVETVFLMAGEQHFYTSSRLVKEVASFGGDVTSFVPAPVLDRFNRRIARPRS